MATAVAISNEDHLVYDWLRQGIQPPKTGLADVRLNGLNSRIRALASLWERLNGLKSEGCLEQGQSILLLSGSKSDVTVRDLWRPYSTAQQVTVPPPRYEDSLSDAPPDYTLTDALATACVTLHQSVPIPSANGSDKLDLSALEGIRSYANKKAKKAAKQVQTAKWAESGDEGEKKEDGGDGAGGEDGAGDGGAGAGGDGGDPPDGGDGGGGGDDNGDEWGFGGGGKKSKKKK